MLKREGFSMRVTLKKWGNNAAVRLPAAIMQAARFELNQTLDVREEGGRVIIEPVDPYGAEPPVYDLDKLLANIRPEDAPPLADFGRPVGDEEW
jgi:antitoxin MazE